MAAEPAVIIKDLHYRYRGQKEYALQGINLEVARGNS
jgi:ABC-type transport system involved in cytochrome bd biosynthesis fused ATPase/permease subunit